MPGQTRSTSLSVRIAALFAACVLLVLGWFAVWAWLVIDAQQRGQTRRSSTDFRQVVASVERLWDGQGDARLVASLERLCLRNNLVHCTIVDSDGHVLARATGAGVSAEGGTLRATSSADLPHSRRGVWEYRVPLQNERQKGQAILVLGWEDDASAGNPLWWRKPILYFGAGSLVGLVLGLWRLARMTRPVDDVERQLAVLAASLSPADVRLSEIAGSSSVALGWNRLVDWHEQATLRDDLEQRLSRAMVQAEQRRGEDVLDSIPDGLAVTDGEGRILFANHALGALVAKGTNGRTLVGDAIDECLGLSAEERANTSLIGTRTARPVVAELDRSVNGTKRIWRVARHPLCSGNGATSGFVWSVRDISQQKMAEEARDQFLSAAAHELRTPLANLRAYAETLALNENLEMERQKEFCNTINMEASRLARLIDDLLNINSMEVGSLTVDRETTDVERLVNEVLDKVRPQMDQRGIQLETDFPEKWPHLNLDKDKIIAALVNVLGNAAKYTEGGGRVTFRIRTEKDQWIMEIQDTGVGISSDELPRIFDKFFRSSDPRVQQETGSGLGLSLVREVIRAHSGTVEVDSQLGTGSTFRITLPA